VVAAAAAAADQKSLNRISHCSQASVRCSWKQNSTHRLNGICNISKDVQ